MQHPVICLDFDGTLLDHEGHMHPRDAAILTSRDHAVFVPSTGRPLHSVRTALVLNGVFVGQSIPLPLVLLNGGAIYRPGEVLVASRYFDPAVQADLLARLPHFPAITFLLYTLDEVHALGLNDATLPTVHRWRLQTRPFDPASVPPVYVKMLVLAATTAQLEPFAAAIDDLPLVRAVAMPGVMEVTPRGVNKAQGVLDLLAELGRDPGCLVAAGDGENDLALLDQAALSFCPDTAPPAIQAHADYIIDRRERGLITPILEIIAQHC